MAETYSEKDQTHVNQLVDHLFRDESGKLVAVLTKILGTENMMTAEDVVQEAMTEAVNQWAYKGVPENPSGWLYNVAKYKALNFFRQKKVQQKYSANTSPSQQSTHDSEPNYDELFSETHIADDQLRMMFTCCHPSISVDSQIAMTLKTLCGFSISEIARAFLTSEENINKRLVRARSIIRENRINFEVPVGSELVKRLNTVLETIYLLFSEGYNASVGEESIRYELCDEAIRLTQLIADHSLIKYKSDVWALLALMLLNASRFKARQSNHTELISLEKQDRTLWNTEYIRQGITYLDRSIENDQVSKYQILATISAHHCTAKSNQETDWESILTLYETLTLLEQSPIVLLNRAIAVSKVRGVDQGLNELKALRFDPLLALYPYYYSTLAELSWLKPNYQEAVGYFEKAISLSHNEREKKHLEIRLLNCKSVF